MWLWDFRTNNVLLDMVENISYFYWCYYGENSSKSNYYPNVTIYSCLDQIISLPHYGIFWTLFQLSQKSPSIWWKLRKNWFTTPLAWAFSMKESEISLFKIYRWFAQIWVWIVIHSDVYSKLNNFDLFHVDSINAFKLTNLNPVEKVSITCKIDTIFNDKLFLYDTNYDFKLFRKELAIAK